MIWNCTLLLSNARPTHTMNKFTLLTLSRFRIDLHWYLWYYIKPKNIPVSIVDHAFRSNLLFKKTTWLARRHISRTSVARADSAVKSIRRYGFFHELPEAISRLRHWKVSVNSVEVLFKPMHGRPRPINLYFKIKLNIKLVKSISLNCFSI